MTATTTTTTIATATRIAKAMTATTTTTTIATATAAKDFFSYHGVAVFRNFLSPFFA